MGEQKERIRKNREKALEIQRKRREENEKIENKDNERGEIFKSSKRQKTADSFPVIKSNSISDRNTVTEDHKYHDVPLEDFEEGASELISKKEAMTLYCLPEGSM